MKIVNRTIEVAGSPEAASIAAIYEIQPPIVLGDQICDAMPREDGNLHKVLNRNRFSYLASTAESSFYLFTNTPSNTRGKIDMPTPNWPETQVRKSEEVTYQNLVNTLAGFALDGRSDLCKDLLGRARLNSYSTNV